MSNQTDSFPSPSNTLEDNVRSIMDDEISEDFGEKISSYQK